MDILLDTHAMLWFVWDDPRLSGPAKALIIDPANRKLFSIASCWEIAIKISVGKLTLNESVRKFLTRELAQNKFQLLPIDFVHGTGVESLPLHHRDPFDRLLVSQALTENIPIVSKDAILGSYGVTRLW